MSDLWCFTCSHEIKRELLSDRYVHLDVDDMANGCPCIEDGESCQP
jgi:hypothetical protein